MMKIGACLSPSTLVDTISATVYLLIQHVLIWLFKPPPPPGPEYPKNPKGRIAVIGAGVTGISSAAHAIAHGFDVVIYEQADTVGGVWARVNETSGLQIHSLLYRFHPGVLWSCSFPNREEVVHEVRRIWKEYHLESRTRFNTRVSLIRRVKGTGPSSQGDALRGSRSRWIINDGEDGIFDAVVATVGTCGMPMRVDFPGLSSEECCTSESDTDHEGKYEGRSEQEVYGGDVVHSSELDDVQFVGRRVLVVGSGASGVEAVETALEKGAKGCVMIARDDKWILPRNVVVGALIAGMPVGREVPLWLNWQKVITWWNYRDVPELLPARIGLFETTPIVNDEFAKIVKSGMCQYVRGDVVRFTGGGVRVKVRARQEKPGEGRCEREYAGDVVVLATGFKRPRLDLFEADLFPRGYDGPNLYLQGFSTEDWSVLTTNATYLHGMGSVGHVHIGIYMRILFMFLMDPATRPTRQEMKLWVDLVRFIKCDAPGGAFNFFTYTELMIWLLLSHIFRLARLKWLFFNMHGWGVHPEEYTDAGRASSGRSERV
ncbi:FAD/NAD-P-binding domain-containing protein [Trametes sanguinea]|nr:FAD/NAD-P-binding domain-containing protein [Trametes sanguinea]